MLSAWSGHAARHRWYLIADYGLIISYTGFLLMVAWSARDALRTGGWLVLETAAGSGERVERLLTDLGFEDVTITPDLAGRDRVAEGRWTS